MVDLAVCALKIFLVNKRPFYVVCDGVKATLVIVIGNSWSRKVSWIPDGSLLNKAAMFSKERKFGQKDTAKKISI